MKVPKGRPLTEAELKEQRKVWSDIEESIKICKRAEIDNGRNDRKLHTVRNESIQKELKRKPRSRKTISS